MDRWFRIRQEKLFMWEPKTAKSTNRVDYRPHWDFEPDIFERMCPAESRVFQGLPSKQLFGQYCQPPSHHLVTQYEESYGTKRNNTLPTLRPWHRDSLTWQPERSDLPISVLPTNLLQSTKRCLEKQQSHLA
uniref:uncharacterized protein C1orf158 homolog n=1 Tax=Solea senegalensis TaxID=28829 RepID=UPI001CD869F8|nr:uncharacterized protein C1orf158 homolog [Solea senegalensis]